jgi:hypothetical protein
MSLLNMSAGSLGKCNDQNCTKGCGIFVSTTPPPLHFQSLCAICSCMAAQHWKQFEGQVPVSFTLLSVLWFYHIFQPKQTQASTSNPKVKSSTEETIFASRTSHTTVPQNPFPGPNKAPFTSFREHAEVWATKIEEDMTAAFEGSGSQFYPAQQVSQLHRPGAHLF